MQEGRVAAGKRLRPSTPVLPAKLAAPRLADAIARTRLFRLLDRARKRPIVWVSAPAGAGKTTLAASYLAARRLRHLWYQLDVRDNDPATFFHYLREAIRKAAPRKRETLPLLTPEYLAGLPVFTRNFFEQLFGRLRPPSVLVLDNYQDAPEEAVLHALLPEALSAIPKGITVLILSRGAPPATLARLQAQLALARLDGESLELTPAEARAIARLHRVPRLAAATFEKLYASIQGWAAGWALIVEQLRSGESHVDDVSADTREGFFDYFATELFARMDPDLRDLLIKCALLPQVSASMAQALTGRKETGPMLAELVHRNYFTMRLSAPEPIYRFHPLFREFLLARGKEVLTAAQRGALLVQAAGLFMANERHDDAVALLQESGDHEELVRLILAQAPILARQGRLATLQSWLQILPEAMLARAPWLSYWFGVSRMFSDPPRARPHLERAYALFKERGEARGMYNAWAAIAETYTYQWDDFTPLDRWFDELHALQERHPLASYPDALPRVAYAALCSMSFARPDRPELGGWVREVEVLMDGGTDASMKIMAATALLLYYTWIGAHGKLRVTEGFLRRRIGDPLVEPFARLYGHLGLVFAEWVAGDIDATDRQIRAGLAFGVQHGIRLFEGPLLGQACYTLEILDDVEGVARCLERLGATVLPVRRLDGAHHDFHAAWLAWRRGRLAQAREHGEKALALTQNLGAGFPVAQTQVLLAQVLAEQGETASAQRLVESAEVLAVAMGSRILKAMTGTTRAWVALRQGSREACARALVDAFAIARHEGYTTFPVWNAKVIASLCGVAIEHGVEIDYTRDLIVKRALKPVAPSWRLEHWPWAVRVYTLGRFEVVIDGKALRFEGKFPRQPLNLLKALIALGGREIPEHRLSEILWPDSEGDAAHKTFASALHRLRKILRQRGILILKDRRLSLDPHHAWTDVWALEHLIDRPPPSAAVLADAESHAIEALYRGPFLQADSETPWILSLRERLREKFLRHLESRSRQLLAAGRVPEAIRLCEQGLEIDPLTEELYRHLMRCHQARGEHARALAVYRRCETVLSNALGVAPSPETQALRRCFQ